MDDKGQHNSLHIFQYYWIINLYITSSKHSILLYKGLTFVSNQDFCYKLWWIQFLWSETKYYLFWWMLYQHFFKKNQNVLYTDVQYQWKPRTSILLEKNEIIYCKFILENVTAGNEYWINYYNIDPFDNTGSFYTPWL